MPKVLLADDSATMQKVVDLVLREQGYEVAAVDRGDEAVSMVNSAPVDMVLAYIKMPVLDGYEICRQIKTNSATAGIPVILLSGAFDPVDEAKMAEVKANGSIVKPFQAEDLIKLIQQHIGAATPAAAAVGGGDDIMFEGEGQAAESFADIAEAAPAESFADVAEAAPVEAEPIMAEPVMEAAPVEAEPVMEAEAFEAEPVMEAAPAVAEPVMEAAPAMEAAPIQAAPVAAAPVVDSAGIEAIVKQSVTEALEALDLKEVVLKTLEPYAKEAFEKIAYDSVPEFLDRTLKGTINESLGTVSRELENIIWETVPELAERLLKQELERIRQESK